MVHAAPAGAVIDVLEAELPGSLRVDPVEDALAPVHEVVALVDPVHVVQPILLVANVSGPVAVSGDPKVFERQRNSRRHFCCF